MEPESPSPYPQVPATCPYPEPTPSGPHDPLQIIIALSTGIGGTRWRSRLRRCATSRKVAGSIPGGVIGFFHWHNPSGRTMALRSTQPVTEMSTRDVSWG